MSPFDSQSSLPQQSYLSPFDTSDGSLSLVVSEGELRADPRAFHGRRITVRALLSRGLEHSTLSIGWCVLPPSEDEDTWQGLHLVEATGVWYCDGHHRFGRLEAYDAELRATRIVALTPAAERTILREELLELAPDEVTVVRIRTEVELGEDRWDARIGDRRVVESTLGCFPSGAPWRAGRRTADMVLAVSPSGMLYIVSAQWVPRASDAPIKVLGAHELDRPIPGCVRVVGQLLAEDGRVFLEGGPVNDRRPIEVSEEIEARLAHGPSIAVVTMDGDEIVDLALVEAMLDPSPRSDALKLTDVFEDPLGFVIEEYELPESTRRVLVRVSENDASAARIQRWERGGFAALESSRHFLRRAVRAWAAAEAHACRAEHLRTVSERLTLRPQRHQLASLAFRELLLAERARIAFAVERAKFGEGVRRAADARRMNR